MLIIENEKAYSTTEVAKILDIQAQTVRKKINNGVLRAQKNCGAFHVKESDLREYAKKESAKNA